MNRYDLKKDMIDVYKSGICKILLNLLRQKLKTDISGKMKEAIWMCLPTLRILAKTPALIEELEFTAYGSSQTDEGIPIIGIVYMMIRLGNVETISYDVMTRKSVMTFNLYELAEPGYEVESIKDMAWTLKTLIARENEKTKREAEEEPCDQTSTLP